MIDTHCHLTHPRFDADLEACLSRATEVGVEVCVTIGTGVEDGRRAERLASTYPRRVHASVGIDPFSAHAAGERFDDELAGLADLLAAGAHCALGEVGLDYHYDLDPRPVQQQRFRAQLQLAERLDLPVVIHVREAHDDMAAILAEHPRNHGVIHSFTAGPAEAERYLACGWFLSFNGVITFRNAADVREAARLTPRDRLLVETDAPYLAPLPHRGRRCEPADVRYTLERLASERGETTALLDDVTTRNARRLFRLPSSPDT